MKKESLASPAAAKIYATLFALVASYMGYEKVEQYRASQPVTVDVTVDSTGEVHAHGQVLSTTDVKRMIREEISAYDAQVKDTYKRLEAWEK